jgi:cytochrome c-type biogenesis protein CcmF
VLLAIFAFALSLLGTFLVRSGVLTSVHAFATDPKRGVFILAFLVIVIGGSLTLFAWRAHRVGLGGRFEVVSRESLLLTNNVLLVVAAGSVLLGTLYPLFLDALGLGKLSVGPPYFETVFVPLMAPALFLMGVGPLARWKQASLPELALRLKWAFAVALVAALLLPLTMGKWTPLASFGLLLATWIVASSVATLLSRLKQTPGTSVGNRLRAQSRSYYGMLLAHMGVAVFVVGVTMVKSYEAEKDVKLAVGDTVELGGYAFRFDALDEVKGPNYRAMRGTMRVTRGGSALTTMYPEKRVYNVQKNAMTEAAINTGFTRDLYVSLGEPVDDKAWVVRVQVKPFVDWIWGGCVLMALGGLLAVLDKRYRVAARSRAETAAAAGAAAAG